MACRVHAHPEAAPQSNKALEELKEAPMAARQHDVSLTVIENLGEWKRSRPLNGQNKASKL